ncbi:MAG: hypothetical protein K9M56_08425 [Victivallales bacterium]|nr:hypothetical protein [Victivallales bacterium]
MKTAFKILFLFSLSLITFLTSAAADSNIEFIEQKEKQDKISTLSNWAIFQIAICPYVPGNIMHSNVCGLKVGLPMSDGRGYVNGLELSLLSSTTSHIAGHQLSPIVNANRIIYGFQSGLINMSSKRAFGLQLATTNINGGDGAGLQVSAINFSRGFYGGLQASAANITGGPVYGLQIGAVNTAESVQGLQIGIFNLAKKSGFQLGVLNIISNGWLPFFPIINFSF